MNIRALKNFVTTKYAEEAPPELTYHGIHHTLDVLRVCNLYLKRLNISGKDAYLLRSAALVHDVGILWDYHNHEKSGNSFLRDLLPRFGYNKSDIEVICNMVLATQIPQQPKTLLEEIICDADLDYLGTDNFYPVGQTLYHEFKAYGIINTEEEWDKLQVSFLESHHYHTEFAQKYRQPIKQQFLQEIKDKWGWK